MMPCKSSVFGCDVNDDARSMNQHFSDILQSVSLQWPIALLLIVFPLGLGVWLIRYPGARWVSSISILTGLILIVIGLSRPMMQGYEPAPLDQVILVIDSSASMRASDVAPSRIDVAKQIARAFIEALPAHANLGLVGMAANASVLQAPTRQRDQLEQALERLSLQPGSALGSGIILATAQVLPEAAIDVERLTGGSSRRSSIPGSPSAPTSPSATPSPATPPSQTTPPLQATPPSPSATTAPSASTPTAPSLQNNEAFLHPQTPVEPGSRENAVIVVLADGDSNIGPAPLEMAAIARLWGLRIYSIGIGTAAGSVLRSEGIAARVRLEDKQLRAVASSTGAEYFAIEDQSAIKQIFASLSGRIGLKKKNRIEVTQWFGLLGGLLVLAGALMNVARQGRIL
jgi:Ca-activated chloride channel homolog